MKTNSGKFDCVHNHLYYYRYYYVNYFLGNCWQNYKTLDNSKYLYTYIIVLKLTTIGFVN